MGDLTNNPVLSMTKGQNKILAGFNPDGTAKFAFTQHDNNPTVGTLQFPDVIITPKSGTIDEFGNVFNNIGGTRYMIAPSGRRYNLGEVPVSNVDPLAKFYVEGTALAPVFNLAGKAGLWGAAKYAPNTWLGNYGRQYYVGNVFKNSFNEKILSPTLNSPTISLLHQPTKYKLNETGSMRFFEKSNKLSQAEKLGIPKGERNFTPKWHIAYYPGYQLKLLMKGSPLEKQLSKQGTISVNSIQALANKSSNVEREVINKILNSQQFSGQKTVDYNQFKKTVQDELIGKYNRVPQTEWADYGMESLGFETLISHDANTIAYNEITGEFEQIAPFTPFKPNYQLNTFTFESPRLPIGSNKHYGTATLGHSRTYTIPDKPNILHILESQSDWGQAKLTNGFKPYSGTSAYLNDPSSYKEFINRHKHLLDEMKANPSDYQEGAIEKQIANIEHHENILKQMLGSEGWSPQAKYLHDNYLQRQLQENLRYAAEQGQTTMRYPTPDTAAKIEGYVKPSPTNRQISWNEYDLIDYSPKHQTILRKYADFPKLFQKLFKGQEVRTVTDAKGNTWFEVDVPKGYLSREWQFKNGGRIVKDFKQKFQKKK